MNDALTPNEHRTIAAALAELATLARRRARGAQWSHIRGVVALRHDSASAWNRLV